MALSIFFASCHRQDSLHQQQFYVFGTLVTISIWGVPESQARQAVELIIHDFQAMHNNWHAWHPSPLTELNQAIANGQPFLVRDKSLLPLLVLSKRFFEQSDGLFNPAIGQLIDLWGFHQDELVNNPPPSLQAISPLVALSPSMNDIEIQGNQVYAKNRSIKLDFGAIAKGYAVDLAIENLRKLGIDNAIINAGGNLKAMGKHGDRAWRIGIRHPSGTGVLAAIETMGEESIMTSGNYERFQEYAGKRYSHILDPRTGFPAQEFTSVTVIHPNGALADAASTALTVAGLQDWQRIARQMGIKTVMLVDAAGIIYMTPDMAKRIQLITKEK